MSIRDYDIKNSAVLDMLEDFRYTYRELYQPELTNNCLFDEMKGKADFYTSEDEMYRYIDMGEDHDGSPESSVCYAIKPQHYNGTHPEEYRKTWNQLNDTMKTELGVQTSALSTLYPPGGFIGWHTNANAAAFNLIFTWSEKGDGWWKHVDPKTGEVITIPDKEGWQLKAGQFGSHGSGNVVLHAAKTNCFRITLGYMLGHDEHYWKDCIDYITNP